MKKWMKELKKETKLMFWLISFYLKKFNSYIKERIQHWNDCFGSVRPSENNTYFKEQLYQCGNEECNRLFNAYPDDVFCTHCGDRNNYSIIECHYGNYFEKENKVVSPKIQMVRRRKLETQIYQ